MENVNEVSSNGKPIKKVKPKVAVVKNDGKTYINFDKSKTNK